MRPPFQIQQQKLSKGIISQLTQLLTQAVEYQNSGENEKAKACYLQVVKIQPLNFDCWHILGIFEYQNKNLEAALTLFKKVIALNPRFAAARSNLGLVLQDLKRYDEAIDSYEKAIDLDPNLYAAYNNCGNAFKDLGKFEKAFESYANAVVLLPDYAEALYNLAETCKFLKRWEESLIYYERAIYSRPNYAEAHNNRGLMLQFLNRIDEAILSFDKTLEIWPEYAPAHSNKSLALLLKGNYRLGWEEHEWRWRMKEFTSEQRNFSQPQWTGQFITNMHSDLIGRDFCESLNSRTIFIHCEQGIGDTLQFCRYIPIVLATGNRVFFEVQASVYSLMKHIIGAKFLIRQGETLPEFDFHCPLISLPFALRNVLNEIPATESYLKADQARKEKWIFKLGERTRPRVGCVWSGNVFHHNDAFRSIPLATLLPYLMEMSDKVDWVCLQKEFREGEQELLRQVPGLIDNSLDIEDFEDTAALCELVDLVVTVDTSVAHLSGALGRPTWLMLPYSPDWRWLMERADSPWYPSMKLYRQNQILNWDSVLETITKDLQNQFSI